MPDKHYDITDMHYTYYDITYNYYILGVVEEEVVGVGGVPGRGGPRWREGTGTPASGVAALLARPPGRTTAATKHCGKDFS